MFYQCEICGNTNADNFQYNENDQSYSCGNCGAKFCNDRFIAYQKIVDALEKHDQQLLAHAKANLYESTHPELSNRKYIEPEDIRTDAQEVKKYSPNDILANFYLLAIDHDTRPLKNYLLRTLKEKDIKEFKDFVPTMIDFLLQFGEVQQIPQILKTFVSQVCSSTKEEGEYLTKIEDMEFAIKPHIPGPMIKRDVFIVYENTDLERACSLCEVLEQNGYTCYFAERNLRRRVGQRFYRTDLEMALRSCRMVLFVSTRASRVMSGADTIDFELRYVQENFPNKPRLEYLAESYNYFKEEDREAVNFLKRFFNGRIYVYPSKNEAELLRRVQQELNDCD